MPTELWGATPRTQAQHHRRDRIVAAATRLLEEQDYDRILIRQVAERAGVALDTLYRYFPSKEHLYVDVLLTWSAASPPVASSGARADSDNERLAAALRRAVRAYERRPSFYRLITVLEASTDPTVASRYGEFADGFEQTVLASFRTTPAADARVISLAARALVGSLLSAWAHGRVPLTQVYADIDRFVSLVLPVRRRPIQPTM